MRRILYASVLLVIVGLLVATIATSSIDPSSEGVDTELVSENDQDDPLLVKIEELMDNIVHKKNQDSIDVIKRAAEGMMHFTSGPRGERFFANLRNRWELIGERPEDVRVEVNEQVSPDGEVLSTVGFTLDHMLTAFIFNENGELILFSMSALCGEVQCCP